MPDDGVLQRDNFTIFALLSFGLLGCRRFGRAVCEICDGLALRTRHQLVQQTVNYICFNKGLFSRYPALSQALDSHIADCRAALP